LVKPDLGKVAGNDEFGARVDSEGDGWYTQDWVDHLDLAERERPAEVDGHH